MSTPATRIDDDVIVARLDESWRTVVSVRGRLRHGLRGEVEHVAAALRRLAQAGRIERREQDTTVPKKRHMPGTTFKVEFYRRRQGSAA